jgi:hypothetical protein
MSQVRGEKQPEFFYELKLVGDGLQNPKKNEQVPKRKRTTTPSDKATSPSAKGRMKEAHKDVFAGMSKNDPIGKAMKERTTAGNVLTVVPNAESHQPMPRTTNLKLHGDYNLRENTRNKEMQKLISRENAPAVQKKRGTISPMRLMTMDKFNK